jgi:hypothetical protein
VVPKSLRCCCCSICSCHNINRCCCCCTGCGGGGTKCRCSRTHVVQWRLLLLLHLWLRRSLRCWVVPQQSCKLSQLLGGVVTMTVRTDCKICCSSDVAQGTGVVLHRLCLAVAVAVRMWHSRHHFCHSEDGRVLPALPALHAAFSSTANSLHNQFLQTA